MVDLAAAGFRWRLDFALGVQRPIHSPHLQRQLVNINPALPAFLLHRNRRLRSPERPRSHSRLRRALNPPATELQLG